MKNILKKEWLEDLYRFVTALGGNHKEVCGHILRMEADFRVLLVTLNAMNGPLGQAAQLGEWMMILIFRDTPENEKYIVFSPKQQNSL